MALFGNQEVVAQLWQKYFQPNEWLGIRSNTFHPLDFRHTSNKDALWIESWSTSHWVTEAFRGKTSFKKAGGCCFGSGSSFYGERQTGNAGDLRSFKRDQFSWTALISQHTKCGQYREALEFYDGMRVGRVKPSSYTFVAVLKACSRLQDLESARKIYTEVVQSGLESHVFVGTMLVDAFAKCGSLVEARHVFEKMPRHDVVSWNAMILGYAQMLEGEEALRLYTRMQQEGVVPDDRTYVAALKACSVLTAVKTANEFTQILLRRQCLDQVRSIHSKLVKTGCELDVFVGTMLVDVYAKCGSLVDARCMFETMPHRNVVSWNAMILGYAQMLQGDEALLLYTRMQEEGIVPDDRTFVGALKACSSLVAMEQGNGCDKSLLRQRCMEQVKAIHSEAENRCKLAIFVGTMLIDSYVKCGSLVDARGVFDKMSHHDVVSWSAMILGYAQMEQGEEALQLYAQMQQEGQVPDDRTFVGALKACSSLLDHKSGILTKKQCLERVRAIHLQVVNSGCEATIFVGTMLVDVYVKYGSLVEARRVFEKMPYHDVVSWTALIFGYAQIEEGEVALQLYVQMQQEGVVPDAQAYVGALKACGSVAGLEKGKEIHAQILKSGLESSDSFLASSLIDMYGKCGSMNDAQEVFDTLDRREVMTWSALIAAYAHQGNSEVVFRLFEKMRQEGIQPNGVIFLSILTACSHAGLVDTGQMYFEAMSRDYGITATIDHFTSMVDLLGRAGQVDKAMETVKTLPFEPDSALWRCVLGACQKWSNVELGQQAFECAVRLDKNDAASYVLMSNIYSCAQMSENASKIQAMRMNLQAGKQPGQTLWTDPQGIVHIFGVEDEHHPQVREIYTTLGELLVETKEV